MTSQALLTLSFRSFQKETFLISKIDESTEFDDFKTESITVYQPQINLYIPEKNFLFKK